MQKKEKVMVALSGGVDSSVAAALLQQATPNNFETLFGRPTPKGFRGYEVEGAFIVPWSPPWLPCTWRTERLDAMRVAAHLRIPFHTVDLSKEYERDVAQYLIREYAAGRTPNPDVMCNKYIKFGAFFDWALAQGFDKVATGHYARVTSDELRVTSERNDHAALGTSHYSLLTGVDRNKDQSYFLWTLTQAQLARTLFPIGEFEKAHVRELATVFGLPTAAKKDSQGICFLGKIDLKEFLSHYLTTTPGDVLDVQGNVIGSHDGAVSYTLGQRHGFIVHHTSPTDEPLFVTAKDIERNTITVAPHMEVGVAKGEQGTQEIVLTDTNWIAGIPMTQNSKLKTLNLSARLRYRQPLFPVTVRELDGTTIVVSDTPQPYVPAGQSLVLYEGDACLGGGIIT
jgi:tRNA-specific 2-thiouridylase